MKQKLERKEKRKAANNPYPPKPPCGTLSYMADCRGMTQKTVPCRCISSLRTGRSAGKNSTGA